MTFLNLLNASLLAGFAATAAWSADMPNESRLRLNLRTQVLKRDQQERSCWEVVTTPTALRASETAILLCDVWDKHWSRGATLRVEQMAPRMNQVAKAARAMGVTIVHAPSDTMSFYNDAPARKRMIDAPRAQMPKPEQRPDPKLPIDDSDGGSDTPDPQGKAWQRQHPAIEIDQDKDGISDNGQEVWNFMQQRGIKNLIIMGVHTNMCVLHRSFAIKAMVRCGVNVVLVRDLTDTMYNPAKPPYVSHEEGTRLVVEFIEKFWCPTIESKDLLRDQ